MLLIHLVLINIHLGLLEGPALPKLGFGLVADETLELVLHALVLAHLPHELAVHLLLTFGQQVWYNAPCLHALNLLFRSKANQRQ